jgi:predicted Fe-Mo cluster-binding NifX family protein
MKIAVSATGGSMNAKISEEFGRCAYFLIVDSDTMRFEPISNPGLGMTGGAGPASASRISAVGAKVVLTGKVGPNARVALDSAGITTVTGFSEAMTVKEAVDQYLKGQNQR